MNSAVKQSLAGLRLLLVLTVLCGVLYPLGVWLVSRLPGLQANAEGSVVEVNGQPAGSELIGIDPVAKDPAHDPWFHTRPSEIDKGAGIDEIRHLTVGAAIAKEYLAEHPSEKDRVVELIARGMRMWAELPVHDMVARREELFQRGLEQHADIVGDYEIWPGRRLVDTTPAERTATAEGWSQDMKQTRLAYIGLEEAA